MDTVNWRDGFPGAGPDFAFRAYLELVGTFALIKLRKYDPGDVRKCLVGHKKQFAAVIPRENAEFGPNRL